MALKLKDLKGAKYNPRFISTDKLEKLQKSINEFGDLSGVVFNKRNGVLVSGHQRVKTIKGQGTKIITEKFKDKYGTIEIGHIEVTSEKGVLKIPFRIVDWDSRTEKLANIAANAQGGDFDDEKLGKLLAELDLNAFAIELSGLDTITVTELVKNHKNKEAGGDESDDEGFDSVDPDALLDADTKCVCPRCHFEFERKKKK